MDTTVRIQRFHLTGRIHRYRTPYLVAGDILPNQILYVSHILEIPVKDRQTLQVVHHFSGQLRTAKHHNVR